MRRQCMAVGLAVACFTASTVAAKAIMIAPPPGPQRLVTAQCVVVGKVTAIEEKTIEASPAAGAPKVLYKVAVVKISDEVKGASGLTSIRVGFVPPVDPPAPPVNGPPIRPIRRFPQTNLAIGQEAVFFLKKHHEKDFYVAPMFYDVVNKEGNAAFDKDVALLKKSARILKNPDESLKSKDAEERLLAAGLLVTSYRTPQGTGKQKLEPIDAAQSKLILEAIAAGDWSKQGRGEITPMSVFGSLNLTPEDGWKPGPFKNYPVEFPAAAKKWLQDNAGKYRVKRFVAEEAGK
jgi:hypothetical protein